MTIAAVLRQAWLLGVRLNVINRTSTGPYPAWDEGLTSRNK